MTKSKQPRKQRKYLYNLPLHRRRKLLSCLLSKELRERYGRRNVPVRSGDTVVVMRGKYRGTKAKVVDVDYKKIKVYLENISRKNTQGKEVLVGFHPSNLMIVDLYLDDPKRKEKLEKQ
jgi:large subunit ribosomal protein L24